MASASLEDRRHPPDCHLSRDVPPCAPSVEQSIGNLVSRSRWRLSPCVGDEHPEHRCRAFARNRGSRFAKFLNFRNQQREERSRTLRRTSSDDGETFQSPNGRAILTTRRLRKAADYEFGGQEFESLRARQSNQGLFEDWVKPNEGRVNSGVNNRGSAAAATRRRTGGSCQPWRDTYHSVVEGTGTSNVVSPR